ncbi:MAG: deoxyribonuclease V [Anaerolineae bacterium]|nr:deoxyribonuclease V [Anaerolineae bacterium]
MHVPAVDFSAYTPQQAAEEQRQLACRAVLCPLPHPPATVAGLDVGIRNGIACAAVVVLSYPDLRAVAWGVARAPVSFPYIPGLLAYREIPVALAALRQLDIAPDVLMCDGQGIAHPRRMGIATHLGILLDHPTIGCAKSRLWGTHGPVGQARGEWQPLDDHGETIGAALRTRAGVKPVYVSPGHRADLDSAIRLVLACAPRYRLPEPTRLAHLLAAVGEAEFMAWVKRKEMKRG